MRWNFPTMNHEPFEYLFAIVFRMVYLVVLRAVFFMFMPFTLPAMHIIWFLRSEMT